MLEQNRSEVGATAVEYALLAALIGGVILSVLLSLGPSVASLFLVPWP